MIDYEGFRKVGKFTLNSGVEVFGELSLNGIATTLKLYSDSLLIHPTDPLKQYKNYSSDIFGVLYDNIGVVHDQSKVSLVKCINTGTTCYDPVRRPDDKYFCEIFFPHIILFGNQHVLSSDRVISGINFTTDDAQDIFHEPQSFGNINLSAAVNEEKTKFNQLIEQDPFFGFEGKQVGAGILPRLFYFNGNKELIVTDTAFGKIIIQNWITGGPSSKGIHVDNNINISVIFNNGKDIHEALDTLRYLMIFLNVFSGRKQSALRFNVVVNNCRFDVYLCLEQVSRLQETQDISRLSRLPIQTTEKPDEFSHILKSWIARHEEWRNARFRFSTSFDHNSYNNDRFIASANMFDILPTSACPSPSALPPDLEEARSNARKMFKSLTASPERDSILNAFGRIGKPSLKRKIRYRAKLITDLVGEHFPEIELILDQAVDCRNYYVHGTDTKIDYSRNTGQVVFFTDTLEFVFAVSDIIESGWDITAWMNNFPACSSHPFGIYLYSYRERLEALKKLLAEKV